MDDVLYLDTARVGQMTPAVGRMLNGIVDLNHAIGSSLYFSDFLFGGHEALPAKFQSEALRPWQGIEALKKSFSEFAIGHPESEIVFVSRSANLISVATKMMSLRCRNVLVTDLNWPFYDQILESSIAFRHCTVTRVPVRNFVFQDKYSANDLADHLTSQFIANQCDGILIPAVCNRGVKLPIGDILKGLEPRIRFSIVDAAQAFNHVDFVDAFQLADFVVGGTQKWLGAYEPLAVGIYSKTGSRIFIEDFFQREFESNLHFDPLLKFGLNHEQCHETVNLNPLYAAAASLKDSATELDGNLKSAREAINEFSRELNWSHQATHPTLNSKIILLGPGEDFGPGVARKLLDRGISVSELPDRRCRFSFRFNPKPHELIRIRNAMSEISR